MVTIGCLATHVAYGTVITVPWLPYSEKFGGDKFGK